MSNGSDRDEPLDPFLRFDLLRTRASRGPASVPAAAQDALRRARLLRLTAPRSRAERTPAAEEEAAPATMLSEIGVQLVDAGGRPIRDEPYRITLSDGREESGKLDARGLARFEGIPRGICKIVFPELHKNPRRRAGASPAASPRGAAARPRPAGSESGASAAAAGEAPAAGAAASREGFDLTVVDAADRPLAGARVRVSQNGRELVVGTLDASGKMRVEGHDPSTPCDVEVLEHAGGCVAVEGGHEDGALDGVLPEYHPGEAGSREEGC